MKHLIISDSTINQMRGQSLGYMNCYEPSQEDAFQIILSLLYTGMGD